MYSITDASFRDTGRFSDGIARRIPPGYTNTRYVAGVVWHSRRYHLMLARKTAAAACSNTTSTSANPASLKAAICDWTQSGMMHRLHRNHMVKTARGKRHGQIGSVYDIDLRPILGAFELGFELGKHPGRKVNRSDPGIGYPDEYEVQL